jgi:hypothetical protein
VLALRIARMAREQRFAPGRMWIIPAALAAFTGFLVVTERYTSAADLGLLALSLAAGGAIGWYQGTHTTVRVDHAARAMFVRISPLGGMIWIGVIVLRIGVRYATGGMDPNAVAAGSAPGGSGVAGLISMCLLVLAVGVIIGLRAYLQRIYARERAGLAQPEGTP